MLQNIWNHCAMIETCPVRRLYRTIAVNPFWWWMRTITTCLSAVSCFQQHYWIWLISRFQSTFCFRWLFLWLSYEYASSFWYFLGLFIEHTLFWGNVSFCPFVFASLFCMLLSENLWTFLPVCFFSHYQLIQPSSNDSLVMFCFKGVYFPICIETI